ncbi:MAG TPA: TusE/DsrC/DsvC family sulfur relay protein [Myxococcota bacterium]|nr:TusE/DsrC/DsvC family sulfur relay protein [Myxococcota bacterium]
MPVIELRDGSIELDEDGYLKGFDQWTEEVARALAERDGIDLGEEHMKVIFIIRDFYSKNQISPMLTLVSKESGNSYKELHKLFGKQPGKRAGKIAGLPKSTGCA